MDPKQGTRALREDGCEGGVGRGREAGEGVGCSGVDRGRWWVGPRWPPLAYLFGTENEHDSAEKMGSIGPRKLVPFVWFAAPVLVPENGHHFGAANRFPSVKLLGNRFTAPESCPFSGTETGAAKRKTETTFLGSLELVFWVQWNHFFG